MTICSALTVVVHPLILHVALTYSPMRAHGLLPETITLHINPHLSLFPSLRRARLSACPLPSCPACPEPALPASVCLPFLFRMTYIPLYVHTPPATLSRRPHRAPSHTEYCQHCQHCQRRAKDPPAAAVPRRTTLSFLCRSWPLAPSCLQPARHLSLVTRHHHRPAANSARPTSSKPAEPRCALHASTTTRLLPVATPKLSLHSPSTVALQAAHHSATTATHAYPLPQSGALTRPLSGAIASTLRQNLEDALSSLFSRHASSLTSLTSLRAFTLRLPPTTCTPRHALQTGQWLSPRQHPFFEAAIVASLPPRQLPFIPQQHAVNSRRWPSQPSRLSARPSTHVLGCAKAFVHVPATESCGSIGWKA